MPPSSPTEGRAWRALLAVVIGGHLLLALGLAGVRSVGLSNWPPAQQLDVSGWRLLVTQGGFWHALAFSAVLTLITLVIAVAAALVLHHALGAELRRGPFARILFLPLAVPGVAAALIAFVMASDSGVLSRIAHALGWLKTPADFPGLLFDTKGRGIVLTHLALVIPLFVLLYDRLAEHLRLPALLAQARALGATSGMAWRRVALPLPLRQAMPVILVYGLALLGAYEIPLMIGGAQPKMISVVIAQAIGGYDLTTRPYGYAMACVYLTLLAGLWAVAVARGGLRRKTL